MVEALQTDSLIITSRHLALWNSERSDRRFHRGSSIREARSNPRGARRPRSRRARYLAFGVRVIFWAFEAGAARAR